MYSQKEMNFFKKYLKLLYSTVFLLELLCSYSVRKFEALDAYRLPAVAKRPSRSSPSVASRTTDNIIPVQILNKQPVEITEQAGMTNMSFSLQENLADDENEATYKRQLQKFLREAPEIRSGLSGTPSHLNDTNYLDSIATSLRSPVPQMRKNVRRVKGRQTPNQKVVNHGKDNLELVMI